MNFAFLPNHVVFRGMPDPRWWNFEDSVTDFGQLNAEHVDLPKRLVMGFALVCGNDWFIVPVLVNIAVSHLDLSAARMGAIIRVTTLVVTDTLGARHSAVLRNRPK